jgi:hypothetical protein
LDIEPELTEAPDAIEIGRAKGAVTADRVRFSYRGERTPCATSRWRSHCSVLHGAAGARTGCVPASRGEGCSRGGYLTAVLHLLQALARLAGRLRGEVSLWRRQRVAVAPVLPLPRTVSIWSE